MVVMYYAPWCSWSKRLLPLFEEASRVLDGKVIFAKVDCVANPGIRDSEHVREYPTVKFHVDEQVMLYDGAHDSANRIVKWVTAHVDTDRHIATTEELDKFLGPRDIHAVAFFPNEKSIQIKGAYDRVSRHFDDILFGETSQVDVIKHLLTRHPPLVKLLESKALSGKAWENRCLMFVVTNHPDVDDRYGLLVTESEAFEVTNEAESEDDPRIEAEINRMHSFILGMRTPSILTFSQTTTDKVFSDPRPLVILFDNTPLPTLQTSIMYKAFKASAQQNKEKFMFLFSGTQNPYQKRLADLGAIEEGDLPAIRLLTLNPDGHAHFYPALKYKGPTKESLHSFVDEKSGVALIDVFLGDFSKGIVKPYLKSEPIPTYANNAVVDVVGLTFDKIVKEDDKDVFVVLYAPWCGHCKRMEQPLTQLAEHLSGVDSLTIARMDATRNEAQDISVQAFPTIKFFKGRRFDSDPAKNFTASQALKDRDGKTVPAPKEVVEYEGARTIEAMAEWIAKHATFPFDPKNPPAAKTATHGAGLLGDEL
eukprot:GDKK01039875.1.p1 GENE.GDKK01039875.1~~GDKK01039875.1.p1  ORF type:complete len:576 (+),score=128.11 GDKK01039875.1:123-1730(+)